MTTVQAVQPVDEGDDYAVAQDLAAIEAMYREALARIASLAEEVVAVDRLDAAAPATGELSVAAGRPPVRGFELVA